MKKILFLLLTLNFLIINTIALPVNKTKHHHKKQLHHFVKKIKKLRVNNKNNLIALDNLIKDPHQAPLKLYSYAALTVDDASGKIIISKNSTIQLPIASITKLMTAMVLIDSGDSLDQYITIDSNDIDNLKKTFSRLSVGSSFKRRDLLLLALMSSENRAAHAIARTTYSGGTAQFIIKMNQKAKALGMMNTVFYDPTGLTPANKSTAYDLAKMVHAAFDYGIIRSYTTTKESDVVVNYNKTHHYMNSDLLVRNDKIQIELSKTGFINEAGHCLVLYSKVGTRSIIMVFLKSSGKIGRILDAIAVTKYITHL